MISDEEHRLLGLYLRGELSPTAERRFAERVASSEELQSLLSDLAVLEAYRSDRSGGAIGGRGGLRPWHVFAAASLVFVTAALFVVLRLASAPPPDAGLDGRLALGLGFGTEPLPSPARPQPEAAWLDTASEPVLALRALMATGQRGKAHRRALAEARDERALNIWNLAVVQEALSLEAVAAQSFEKAAATEADAEYARQARSRARWLEDGVEASRVAHERARLAGRALIVDGTPFPPALGRSLPGLLRLYLYDALRAARTPLEVEGLEVSIDLLPPEQVETLRRERDATLMLLRKPDYLLLAERYRASFESSSAEALMALSKKAEALGAYSMALGALVRSRQAAPLPDAVARYTREREDRWLEVLGWKVALKRDFFDGELENHWDEYFAIVDRAQSLFRRADLGLWVAYYALRLRRLDLARELVQRLADDSSRMSLTRLRLYLQLQAKVSLADGRFPETRDFAQEAIERSDSCATKMVARDAIASTAVFQGDLSGMFEVLQQAASEGCEQPLSFELLSEVRRRAPKPSSPELRAWWTEALRQRMTESGLSVAERAGFELEEKLFGLQGGESDPDEVLKAILSFPEGVDRQLDREARLETARVLLVSALQENEPTRGASMAAAALRIELEPCLVFVDPSLSVKVAMGRKLVPKLFETWKEVGTALEGCEELRVVPLSDALDLPPDAFRLAWSILALRGQPPKKVGMRGLRLSIVNPAPPLNARLAALPPFVTPGGERAVVLSGVSATPSSALVKLPEASVIEVFAHGVDDGSGMDRTSIALSPDPGGDYRLDASELLQKRLRGDAAVFLAVCQSARVGAPGVQNVALPQAFAWAGAQHVVAALGPIPVNEGAELFRELTDAVESGQSPSRALHRIKSAEGGPTPRWLQDVVVFSTQDAGLP
ncbi:MAG: CHAT domain-containing protein [Myxococcota bacterium]